MNKLFNCIGLDLGTANARFYKEGKLVLETPTVVEMEGKTIDNLIVKGNIGNFYATERFLANKIEKIEKPVFKILFLKFTRGFTALVSVPADSKDVQLRAYRDALAYMGGQIFMLNDCYILATGLDIDLKNSTSMIVNFGAGKTSITTLRNMEILCNDVVPVSGKECDEAIKLYLRREHELDIDIKKAEELKIQYADFHPNAVDISMRISGLIKNTETPKGITIQSSGLSNYIRNDMEILADRIIRQLENHDPDVREKLLAGNIYLTGGGFKMKGLVDFIAQRVNISAKSYNINADYMRLGFEKILTNPADVWDRMMK